MSNAWDNAAKLAEKHATGGVFVRLQKDGDKVVGVFCGEPYAREVYWDGQKYVDTPPEGVAAKASLRVSLNFYVPAEGTMKIIEGGTAWFKDLLAVRDKYGLDRHSFEIKRRGAKGDPKTKYSILPDAPVDDAMRARIAAAGLHDLTKVGPANDGAEGGVGEAPGTIDLDTARALADRLRALPRPVCDSFLAEFKIGRIRELANRDLPRANAFVSQHEQPATRDPFEL